MESYQKDLIRNNRDDLIQNTACTTLFLSIFFSKEILSKEDLQIINLAERNGGLYAASDKFYDIITTRTGGFNLLLKALEDTSQTGALRLLNTKMDNQQPSSSTRNASESQNETEDARQISPAMRKFKSVPDYLKKFLADPSINMLIILSADCQITCKRIKETYDNCQVFNSSQEFLNAVTIMSRRVTTMPLPMLNCEEKLEENFRLSFNIKVKFVLVSRKSCFVGNEIENIPVFKRLQKHRFSIEEDIINWADLIESFQLHLCTQIENYPNIFLTRNQILDALEEADCLTLVKLMNEETLELFNNTIPPPINYYIVRSLSYRNEVGKNIFTIDCSDVFVFKGIHKEELRTMTANQTVASSSKIIELDYQLLSRFLVLDHDDHFSRICKNLPNKSAHLLNFDGKNFIWQKTFGNVNSIQQCLHPRQPFCCETNFIENIVKVSKVEQLSICISDSPGMGKSVLLANIARNLQKQIPDGHVGFVVIGDLIGSIKSEHQGVLDIKQIIVNKLTCCLGSNRIGAVYLRVNRTYLKHVLLDGFDEINNEDEKLGYDLLKIIQQVFPNTTLWVTSRPHLLQKLERELGVMGFNIIPFCETDQMNFLTSFWNRKSEAVLNGNKLSVFSKHCLENVKSTLDAKEQDIAGIPLQCLLIGEVFEEEAITFCQSNDDVISLHIPIYHMIQLYERLIDKKLNIFFSLDKNSFKTPSEINRSRGFFDKFISLLLQTLFSATTPLTRQDLEKMHMFESVSLFFPTLAPKLRTILRCKDVSLEQIVNCGLMEVKHSFSPSFVHRTIAEYFVASLFIDSLENHFHKNLKTRLFAEIFTVQEASINPTNEFVLNCFEFKNHVICYFIDALLGRLNPHSELGNQLLTNVSIDVQRHIAKACAAGNFQNIFALLFSHPNTHTNIYVDHFLLELVFITVYRGCLRMLIVCTNLGNFSRFTMSEYLYKNHTLLHFAVYGGNFEMVKHLCENENFGGKIFEANDNFQDLVSLCIKETKTLSDKLLEDRRLILVYIWTINKNLFMHAHSAGQVLFLRDDVHIKLASEIIGLFRMDLHMSQCLLHTTTQFLDGTSYLRLLRILCIDKTNTDIFILFTSRLGNLSLVQKIVKYVEPQDELCEFLASIDFDALSLKELIFKYTLKTARSNWLVWLLDNKRVIDKKVMTSSVHLFWDFHIELVQQHLDLLTLKNHRDKETNSLHSLITAYNEGVLDCLNVEYVMKFLCEKGVDVNAVNKNEESLLHLSLKNHKFWKIPTIVKVLVEAGVDINIQDAEGNTPLHIAMTNNLHQVVIDSLIENQADVNMKNNNKESPLSISVSQGIRERGVNISIILKGNTNFEKIYHEGNSIFHILLENTKKTNPVIIGKFSFIVEYLSSVGRLDLLLIPNNNGKTPLHLAQERNLVTSNTFSLIKREFDVEFHKYYSQFSLSLQCNL